MPFTCSFSHLRINRVWEKIFFNPLLLKMGTDVDVTSWMLSSSDMLKPYYTWHRVSLWRIHKYQLIDMSVSNKHIFFFYNEQLTPISIRYSALARKYIPSIYTFDMYIRYIDFIRYFLLTRGWAESTAMYLFRVYLWFCSNDSLKNFRNGLPV